MLSGGCEAVTLMRFRKRTSKILLSLAISLTASCASYQSPLLLVGDAIPLPPVADHAHVPPSGRQAGLSQAEATSPLVPPTSQEKETMPGAIKQIGIASWYGRRDQGRRTASGERFSVAGYTAAHRSLPFGTLVKVRNLDNRREIVVRITDRGPFIKGRIIDLSPAAAKEIGISRSGTARVEIEVLPIR